MTVVRMLWVGMAALLAATFGAPAPAVAQDYPNQRVTIVVPFGAGSVTDIMARILADELAKRWNCSRATVYNVLRESELKALNVAQKSAKKGKWNVPAAVVEHIEQSRMESLPEPASHKLQEEQSAAAWP